MCSISKSIKIALVKNDMKQKDFCKRFNYEEATLSRQLKKKDSDFISKDLKKIAEALGCEVKITLIDKKTGEEI